jgi:hypothetical protein
VPEHTDGPRATDHTGATDDTEPVGTLAEEAMKLFSAVVSQAGEPTAEDEPADDAQPGSTHGPGESCPHGGCPVCSTVEFVQDHPEVVAQVFSAGHELLKAMRSVVETAAADRRGES